jgi:hypothetical protein
MALRVLTTKKYQCTAKYNAGGNTIVDWKPVSPAGDTEAAALNAGILTTPPCRITYTDANHPDLDGLQIGDQTYLIGATSY